MYLQKLAETSSFEQMIQYVSTHYDEVLLKSYSFLQRYQTVNENDTNCLRYYFKTFAELEAEISADSKKAKQSAEK